MGGNAFRALLPNAQFPRLDPSLYQALKTAHTSRLKDFYSWVATPHEAPGKADHGDIDFVVCQLRDGLTLDDVRLALGATHNITSGDSMAHFAIPLPPKSTPSSQLEQYYQVDLQICAEPDAWQRTIFFSSYGDVGMILGLMARSVKMSLGRNGLKLADPLPTSPSSTFHLSSSFPQILEFFHLSMERWERGFSSQTEIFSWLASSRFFDSRSMLRSNTGNTSNMKARDARTMYQNFLVYAQDCDSGSKKLDADAVLGEALDFFGKRDLYTVFGHIAAAKRHIGSIFTGRLVQEWTGLQGVPVRFVMDEVRARLGGEDVLSIVAGISLDSLPSGDIDPVHLTLRAWESAMESMSVDEVKTMVVRVKEELAAGGKLEFDWRAAKQRKAEQKRLRAEAQTQSL